ncbi:unnamed protein product [Rotaria sp. Silwood2]|nr:unnamed protein product [Rotaria sp. Silwood2]CAF2782248.1 unnamed protein product [Rotaria sp. Silwood2]CAF3040066.1 unnamed protein product [Rotaria sp. Silwood2]CAF3495877.1 unnamed protein product [Rotaria sp. Silwood2]CAF4161996.1 unnamed protein product [Rotaria sp. Silwood2]
MGESNITLSDQMHQIFILSSKPVADHTGTYVVLLLTILLFILLFYLMYNFISYKRYSISRKNQMNSSLYSTEQLNDHLSFVLGQTIKSKPESHVKLNDELKIPLHRLPLQTTTTLSMYPNLRQTKNFISNQYEITNQLISDL